MVKLSVIIPVFNVEGFLERCLDSVAVALPEDSEVVLVDDCSTDGSGCICDERVLRDDRFSVVHCGVNVGLGAARNVGLDRAVGEFVAFVDSDDYVDEHVFSDNLRLLCGVSGVDVLEFPVCVGGGDGGGEHFYVPGVCGCVEDFGGWVVRGGYVHAYAWNKIYRASLWCGVRFPEDRLFEDAFVVPSVLQRAGRVMTSDVGVYHYCRRVGSISDSVCLRGVSDLFDAYLDLYFSLVDFPGLGCDVLDDLYLFLCNHFIVLSGLGGKRSVPVRRISFRGALCRRRRLNYRLKALLWWVFGGGYCGVLVGLRKLLGR